MKELYTFDDVLIEPKFSTIESRRDVDLSFDSVFYPSMTLPVLSANMDTITGAAMSQAMLAYGAQAVIHRFQSIEDNMKMFLEGSRNLPCKPNHPMVSIGLGKKELERAQALKDLGAYCYVVDVAHGSQMSVVNQVKALRNVIGDSVSIIVGNFATGRSVRDFLSHLGDTRVEGFKLGIGPGSACTTRIQTGCGIPQLSAIVDVAEELKYTGITIIADGGLKTPGDCAKALGAGAHIVMIGGMLAGTEESPGEGITRRESLSPGDLLTQITHKKYRGSASKESYEAQGKDETWRAAEGESFYVPYKGPVKDVLQNIEGGLRSAFTYTGSRTLEEFHKNCEFVRISPSTVQENKAHGRRD